MKTLFYILLLFLPLTKPSEPDKWLREFMRDAVNQQLSNTELAKKHFCTMIFQRTDEPGEKARKSIDWVLTMQRDGLRQQQVNIDDVTFKPFDQLSTDEIPPKPFHMLGETTHVYVALYQGKIILYFLLQEDKIASTLLLGQGDEHYFINFCR